MIMKRLILTTIIAIITSIFGAVASTLTEQADSAYMAENYQMAAAIYNKILKEEGSSASLYYNLGNCYYRLGENGKAIVASILRAPIRATILSLSTEKS